MRDAHDAVTTGTAAAARQRACAPIRLLYTDLHGIARGKDIPISKFEDLAEEGVAFCAAVMSTDLRHTPVVGGEEGYVDFAVRPDLATLRVVPWQPDVAWCIGEAWTLGRLRRTGADCPRGLLERVVARYAERGLTPIVGPELEFFLLERDPDAPRRPSPLRRRALARLHRRRRSPIRAGSCCEMLYACERARPAGVRREPRVHELAVRDQRRALGGARRRRPRVPAQDGGEGARRAAGDGRDVHGQAVQRPGRLGLPRPPLARGRRRATTPSPTRAAPHGLGPLRAQFVAGRARARARPDGTARADRERVQAARPRQPRADARELGARQPHRVRAACRNERGSRSRVEVRGGDGSACAAPDRSPALLLAGLDGIERGLELPRRRSSATPTAPTTATPARAARRPRRGARRARGRRRACVEALGEAARRHVLRR